MGLFVSPRNENSELAGRNRSVSGQDRKFPPAPGTNQIAGFREFRLLTNQEKKINGKYFRRAAQP